MISFSEVLKSLLISSQNNLPESQKLELAIFSFKYSMSGKGFHFFRQKNLFGFKKDVPPHFFTCQMNLDNQFENLFSDIPDEEWDSPSSQEYHSEVLHLADGSLVNNLMVLDQLQPPAPVFLNNPVNQENNAIYFKDYKLMREFIRSNKDLSEQYFILLPIGNYGAFRFDNRQRLHPAVLYKKNLIK